MGMGMSMSQPSSTSSMQIDDVNIDPQLRNQGHVVGHGHMRSIGPVARSSTRRAHSPYTAGSSSGPSQAQSRVGTPNVGSSMPPPQMMGQSLMSAPERTQQQMAFNPYASLAQAPFNASPFGHAMFSQPPVSQTSMNWFEQMPQQMSMQAPPSGPTMAIPPLARSSRSASEASRQDMDIRHAPIRQPTPRPGIEHVRSASGFVVARRIDSGNAGHATGSAFPQQQHYLAQAMPPRGGGPSHGQRRDRSSSSSSRD